MTDARPLLLTGFEPFGPFAVNPSWHAAASAAERFGGRVVARRLPVDYVPARLQLLATLDEVRPVAVLCMGLAAGDVFRFERIARRPAQLADVPGPDVLVGTWPWGDAERVLTAAGEPCRYSDDAGQYVCESTYWSLLNARPAGDIRPMGFLHVPAESAAFSVERVANAVVAVVGAFLGNGADSIPGRTPHRVNA